MAIGDCRTWTNNGFADLLRMEPLMREFYNSSIIALRAVVGTLLSTLVDRLAEFKTAVDNFKTDHMVPGAVIPKEAISSLLSGNSTLTQISQYVFVTKKLSQVLQTQFSDGALADGNVLKTAVS